jgi:predicted secreted protein
MRVFLMVALLALACSARRVVREVPRDLKFPDSSNIREHHVDDMSHEEVRHHLRLRKVACPECSQDDYHRKLKAVVDEHVHPLKDIERHERMIDAFERRVKAMQEANAEHHESLQRLAEGIQINGRYTAPVPTPKAQPTSGSDDADFATPAAAMGSEAVDGDVVDL